MPQQDSCCEICGRQTFLEEHHITPVGYGGDKNGPTIFICADCHGNLHRMAENLTSKTAERQNFFGSKELLIKAKPYVQAIMSAKLRFKEHLDPGSQDIKKRKMIVLEFSEREWLKIRKAGKDRGYKNNNDFIHDYLLQLTKF